MHMEGFIVASKGGKRGVADISAHSACLIDMNVYHLGRQKVVLRADRNERNYRHFIAETFQC